MRDHATYQKDRYQTLRRMQMRVSARKDKNHDAVVQNFEQCGCCVLELHHAGWGLPDLMVLCLGVWHAVEVKNPQTSYGRKGLNARQQALNRTVQESIEIARTQDDVLRLVMRWRGAGGVGTR